ncbi:EmrB/QacA subfamily drug resistance transporter [Thermocatellispora tengchongensis]|uniref:EmrB/QacA subfamily drug resistance transporter n=1 Tax=Thermocatellispora tengchongensis TaxID=1073253 RepID=A0A840P0I9_9ACTN|nr:MFS transporter [Thermocatellispora tengchongensis]MBB5131976.1 EmrB/QacA subfamily drug resistance transporter [Thermocatellispora tengchongensis]
MSASIGPGQTPPGDGHVRFGTATGRWVLLTTVLASGMAMLDATVVNVALPALGESLGAGMSGLQWTVNAYTLTLAGLILLGGSLGDRYGRRRIFLIGVIWFAVASAMCGLAPDIQTLVAARALQGVGGALLTPGSLAIIQASFVREDRPRAVGAWSGLGGVAGAVGPLVGGGLVESVGWRWVFLLNLPLAALVLAVAIPHVPETRDTEAAGRFDVLGAALAALALAALTYGLIDIAPLPLLAGAALGAAFAWLEIRRSPQALVPVGVFRSREFTAINVVTLIMYAAMGVVFFLLVVQLQVSAGFSAVAAGSAMLPVTLLMLLLSARAGELARRIGPRLPMTLGILATAAGMLLLSRVGPGAMYLVDVLPAVTLFGLGLSAAVAPLTATVLATAEERYAGVASGVNNAVARTGGLLAVAAIPPLAGLTGAAYTSPAGFTAGFRISMLVSAAMLALAALVAFVTIRRNVLAEPEAPRPECRTHCAVGAPPLETGRDGAGDVRR